MSTYVPGFHQFSAFLHQFVLNKFATCSQAVKKIFEGETFIEILKKIFEEEMLLQLYLKYFFQCMLNSQVNFKRYHRSL